MLIYDKELERTLRARKLLFAHATEKAGREWLELDIADAFATWMAGDEYRDRYFQSPGALQLKLQAEFPRYVADLIRRRLSDDRANDKSVVGVFGAGALFGFAHVSHVVSLVEADIRGRMAVFFPGQKSESAYHLLDARDGWNYLAVPITADGSGERA